MTLKMTAARWPLAALLMALPLTSMAVADNHGDDGQGDDWFVIGMHPSHEPQMMYIHFVDGVPPNEAMTVLTEQGLPEFIPLMSGAEWILATGDLDLESLQAMHATAEERLQQTIPKPWQGVYVALLPETDTWAAIEAAREVGFVDKAIPVPMVVDPPWSHQGDFQSQQGYLGSSTNNGINAEAVWAIHGTTGQGIEFCDIEYQCNPDHCDLPAITTLGPMYAAGFGNSHGTATIGEVVALDDGVGTTGVAYGVDQTYFCPSFVLMTSRLRLGIDYAILKSGGTMDVGDVILLEGQIGGPRHDPTSGTQSGLVPVEWFEPTYHAIRIAVANGRVVVEAAGNGREDLDDPLYSLEIDMGSAGIARINDGHWPFLVSRDSGAIIVGAGRSGVFGFARTRQGFSNVGATVDLQGWGDNITTTGPSAGSGTFWSEQDCEYRSDFGGTSGAAPIVAGACILVQSWCKENLGATLNPESLKWRLQLSGQPQVGNGGIDPASERIGPLPDVLACIAALGGGETYRYVPWVYGTIQEAVDAANSGDTIMVAAGSWTGFQYFGKSLKFRGLDGAASTIIDGEGTNPCIVCQQGDLSVDGFTIQNCRSEEGAGIFFEGGTLQVDDCILKNNEATSAGGALYSFSQHTGLVNCTFRDNIAGAWGGAGSIQADDVRIENCYLDQNEAWVGGGFRVSTPDLTVTDTLFNRNDASAGAGGLDLTSSWDAAAQAVITDCQFMSNTGRRGGGVVVNENDLTLLRCQFMNNGSDEQGGALFIDDGLTVVDQCRFSNNVAGSGYSGGAIGCQEWNPEPKVSMSMFCNNTLEHIDNPFNDLGGNCFADSCADADEDNVPDSCQAAGDVNGDGEIDINDLLAIIAAFGDCDGCPEDLNGDGTVDVNDLLIVLACWGGAC